ncbi:hypothetical protein EMEDMD4_120026 [Sinorhizobium medicae]|uniref:Uncharacterized protein n=1 Tax=Sinorhizobium medicae TaxID=110321 RepID=A0A508WQD6_9HYPH|nr:hypothetical protein EMEDMD4_120026 [Sinorhizobium medicae]
MPRLFSLRSSCHPAIGASLRDLMSRTLIEVRDTSKTTVPGLHFFEDRADRFSCRELTQSLEESAGKVNSPDASILAMAKPMPESSRSRR